jgi:hypothetical protein
MIRRPPRSTLSPADLDRIFSQSDSTIIVGDLNCKHVSWNNTSVNRNGRAFLTYCIDKGVTLSYTDQPTYFLHHFDPSILDIALTKRCPLSKPKTVPALSSDHNPIMFKILLHPTTFKPRIRYIYPHADWPLFQTTLDLALDRDLPVHTILDLEHAITIFETSVQQAAHSAIPVHTVHHTHLPLPPLVHMILKLKYYYR